MATILVDGTGTGQKAGIDPLNRLQVNAITQDINNFHSVTGDHYNLNTDSVTLTGTGESAILYIKNNEDRDLVIDAFVQIIGNSTGGSGNLLSYIYRNPTGGTIVSDANITTIQSNLNYGSSNTLNCDIFTGGEGKTQTGGEKSLSSILGSPTTNVVSVGDIILPKGSSVCVTIQPQAGNTSMVVHVAALCYLKKAELK